MSIDLAVARAIQVLTMLVYVRQACSGGSINVRETEERMASDATRDELDEWSRQGDNAKLDTSKLSVTKVKAVQNLNDECTICLEVLEEPLQTLCKHLFCGEW